MRFSPPLVPARLVRRYKRFLADVEFADGQGATAHCANPGAMLGLAAPGATVLLSPAASPARKLRWSWELVEVPGGHWAGINTGHPNAVVAEAITAGRVAELAGYSDLRREVKYGRNSRIDILLSGPGRPDAYVEVKNVHLKRDNALPGLAEFPDSVTARGAKHLLELAEMVRSGHRAVMFYLVQRTDCDRLAFAEDIDPAYGAGLAAALSAGVEVIAYDCHISPQEINLRRRLSVSPPRGVGIAAGTEGRAAPARRPAQFRQRTGR